MANQDINRRQFLSASALAAAGFAMLPAVSFGAPAYIRNLGKPNSLFNGVQVGAITYSWRSMPGSAEDILKYCIEANVSAIELMGPTGESFAGAPEGPKMPPWTGGKRPELTDEQKAALKSQTLTTFESFYDYYESLYSFKAAIKAAADTKGTKTDINVEKED